MRISRLLPVLSLAALAACAPGKSVPLHVARCNVVAAKGAVSVDARVTNLGDRPMTSAQIALDLYRDYRFTRVEGTVSFSPVLDPGTSRDVTFEAQAPGATSGSAMHCTATRAVFGDGSVENADS